MTSTAAAAASLRHRSTTPGMRSNRYGRSRYLLFVLHPSSRNSRGGLTTKPDQRFRFPWTRPTGWERPHERSTRWCQVAWLDRRAVCRFSHRPRSKVNGVSSRAKHRPLCIPSTPPISPRTESLPCFPPAVTSPQKSIHLLAHAERTNEPCTKWMH